MWWRIILSIFHRINKPKAESRISPSTQFQNENQVKEGGREGRALSLPPPRRPYFLLFSQETTTLEIRFRSSERGSSSENGALQQIGLDFQLPTNEDRTEWRAPYL